MCQAKSGGGSAVDLPPHVRAGFLRVSTWFVLLTLPLLSFSSLFLLLSCIVILDAVSIVGYESFTSPLVRDPLGRIIYEPNASYAGIDVLNVSATDCPGIMRNEFALSDAAVATLYVRSLNQPPALRDQQTGGQAPSLILDTTDAAPPIPVFLKEYASDPDATKANATQLASLVTQSLGPADVLFLKTVEADGLRSLSLFVCQLPTRGALFNSAADADAARSGLSSSRKNNSYRAMNSTLLTGSAPLVMGSFLSPSFNFVYAPALCRTREAMYTAVIVVCASDGALTSVSNASIRVAVTCVPREDLVGGFSSAALMGITFSAAIVIILSGVAVISLLKRVMRRRARHSSVINPEHFMSPDEALQRSLRFEFIEGLCHFFLEVFCSSPFSAGVFVASPP